jgi:hypothetical protein
LIIESDEKSLCTRWKSTNDLRTDPERLMMLSSEQVHDFQAGAVLRGNLQSLSEQRLEWSSKTDTCSRFLSDFFIPLVVAAGLDPWSVGDPRGRR